MLELVVSFCLIFILIGTFGAYASKVLVVAKEVALLNELGNLRLSLELYKAMHDNAVPKDLKELYSIKNYFVMIDRLDKDGMLLDPFGSRYYYDPKKRAIRSTAVKYKNW